MMGLQSSFFCVALLGCAVAAAESPDPEKSADKMITPAAQHSIDQALQWLAARQNDDGSFGIGVQRGNAAVCGLAGMAFLAGGSTPGRGPYGDRVQRAIDYLLSIAQPSGFICEASPANYGPMYSHGFATLFLAECYGMSPRKELRDKKLSMAVTLIVNTQNSEGGWRYEPKIAEFADISVTVCQVMALRAAHNAGIHVPKKTFDRAVAYVMQSQNTNGGFVYTLKSGGESAFPRSAAAVVALNSAGIYQEQEKQPDGIKKDPDYEKKQAAIKKGLEYLDQFRPAPGEVRRDQQYVEYGHYYAVQAMWQAGGQRWDRWYPAVSKELIAQQAPNGSWTTGWSAECTTAMCLLVLQMPENQLPIFQR